MVETGIRADQYVATGIIKILGHFPEIMSTTEQMDYMDSQYDSVLITGETGFLMIKNIRIME